MNLQPGQILADKYRIVRQIGQGGMGSVYEGENIRIHRRVAIKTLHAQVAGKSDVLQRFEREAQAAGRIGSEHIVEVLDMGDLQDGSRFMVMEFLDGTTLGDRIVKQGRIAPRDLVSVMSQMLDGLNAAHQAGIIHRDLKPANVFLLSSRGGRPDFVKILDFGVSKFNVLNSDEMSMTRTGAVMGTPYYMSPEQAKGARTIDARSDLYSVGVIIYEAVTGQVPFNAETFNELIFKIALESPPPPEQFVPNLDQAFGVLMRRAMARDPNERYQTAADLKEAMLAWARDFDARGGGTIAMGPRAGTQMLPMVGAVNPRASYPSAPGVAPGPMGHAPMGPTGHAPMMHGQMGAAPMGAPPAPGVAATVAGQPYGPGQTQYAALADATTTSGGRKRSSAPIVIAAALAVGLIGGTAFFFYGRSSAANAGPSTTATATSTSEPAPSAEPVATSTSSPTAETAATSTAVEPTALPTADASSAVASQAPTAPTTPSPVVGTRPTNRPTGTVPTATAKPTATAAQPTSTKAGGRDIRPDL
ncbi:MAG: protein kinase [Polyangiaceae bacterium]|nr:protein kinase [Polyangiaceae bacterium]